MLRLLTAAISLVLIAQSSAQYECGAVVNTANNEVILTCTVDGQPYTGVVYYAIGQAATIDSRSGVSPVSIPLSNFNEGANELNVLILVGSQELRLSLGVNIQATTTSSFSCNAQQSSSAVTINCSGTYSSAGYSINGGQEQTVSGFPLVIGISELIAGVANNLTLLVDVGGGTIQRIQFTITPQTATSSFSCNAHQSSSAVTINCSGTYSSAGYSINGGQEQTVSGFPLVIGISELIAGVANNLTLLVDVGGGTIQRRLFTITPQTATSSFSCNAHQSSSAVTINCSGTYSSAGYSINGGQEQTVTGFPLVIGISELIAGVANNLTLLVDVGGGTIQRRLFTITPQTVGLSAECVYRFVDGNMFLEVNCTRTGGTQDITSLRYSINGGAVTTVTGSSFRIANSQLNVTNTISVTIVGSRNTERTVSFSATLPIQVSCRGMYVENGDLKITCSPSDILSIMYRLNGGPYMQVPPGQTMFLIPREDLNPGTNYIEIKVVTASGVTVNVPRLDFNAPIRCTSLIAANRIIYSCSGGIENVLRYQYIINGEVFYGTGFPIIINSSQLSTTETNTVMVTLLGSDDTELSQATFNVQPSQIIIFIVSCRAVFIGNEGDLRLEVTCTTSDNSTQSIGSLRYSLNGGSETTVEGSSFNITENLRSDRNTLSIRAIGTQGTQLTLPDIVLSAPTGCSYRLDETNLLISCSEGGTEVVRCVYILNGGTPIDTGYPIMIDRNLFSTDTSNTLVIRLLREDGSQVGETTFTIQSLTLSFRVYCNASFVGNGTDTDLLVTCNAPPGSSQTISTLRYSLNSGSEVTVSGSSFIISGSNLSDGSVSTLDITAVGNQGTELDLQLTVQPLVNCVYSIVGNQIVITCNGATGQVVRYEYIINGLTITGTRLPIRIDTSNTNGMIVLKLYASGNRLISTTKLTFPAQVPATSAVTMPVMPTATTSVVPGGQSSTAVPTTLSTLSDSSGSATPTPAPTSSPAPLIVGLSAECVYRFVDGNMFLEVDCTRTGGTQDITSLRYSINGGAVTTVTGSSFRIANSQLNVTNTISVTIVGSRNTERTVSFPATLPISCSSTVDQANNQLVITCASGGRPVTVYYQYNYIGSSQIFTGVTGPGSPIIISLAGSQSGQSLFLSLRRTDNTSAVVAEQQITISRVQVSCRGMYVENGDLKITCSPSDISSIMYSLNGGPLAQVPAGQIMFLIPAADLNSTSNYVLLRVVTASGATVDVPRLDFNAPIRCTSLIAANRIIYSCSGGIENIIRYRYIINGEVFYGTGFPIIINSSQLSTTETNTVMVTLLGSGDIELSQATFNVQPSQIIIFIVSCRAVFIGNEGDLRLEVTCTTSDNSTQSIGSLRYSLNGGSETTVEGSSFNITENLRSDTNTLSIRAIGTQGTQLTLPDIVLSAPTGCSYRLDETNLIISCSGGGTEVVRYQYILNGGTPIDTGYPIILDRNLFSTNTSNTLVIRLLREDGSQVGETTFNIQSLTLSFRVVCTASFVGDGTDRDLQVTCNAPPGSSQTISTLRYRLNSGSEVTVSGSSFIISGIDGSTSTLDITAVGNQGTELDLQLLVQPPVDCVYSIEGNQIVITCNGATGQVVRYEYTINSGQNITGTEFPIRIDTNNTDLVTNGMNVVVLKLYASRNRLISTTNFTFPAQVPVSFRVVCNASFVGDGTDRDLLVTCNAPPGSSQTISTLRYRLNSGSEVTVSGSSFIISGSDLIDGSTSTLDITAVGNQGTELDLQLIVRPPVPSTEPPVPGTEPPIPELSVPCVRSAVPGRETITCTPSNPNVVITCRFDGGAPVPCTFPLTLNFNEYGFVPHTINVTVTDNFGQTVLLNLGFQLARPLSQPPISITFNAVRSVSEEVGSNGESPDALYTFSIEGTSLDTFRYSLVPLTYQQYQMTTGNTVSSVFGSNIPLPASEADIRDSGRFTYEFGPASFPLAGTVIYNLSTAIVGDNEVEYNEGFILYLDFDDNNNPSDNADAVAGDRAILVTILNDDGEVSVTFPLTATVEENAVEELLRFGYQGVWLDTFDFSLVPVTYQEFTALTGQSVSSLVPPGAVGTIPPPASPSDIQGISGRMEYSSSPNPKLPALAADAIYDLASAVVDDTLVEGNEGFVLYFDHNEANNPSDTVTSSSRGILVTIIDNDRGVTPGLRFQINCTEIVDDFFGGLTCITGGAVGDIRYFCSFDGGASQQCMIPLVINRIRYSLGEHTLQLVAVDSRGASANYTYTFSGRRAPELVLTVTPTYTFVGEDGSSSGNIRVTKSGYSFGKINFSLVPLTYSEYVSVVGGNLNDTFPLRPYTPASSSDFVDTERTSIFPPGLVPQPPFVVPGSGLVLPDSEAEFTEGFLFYLKINRSTLHIDDQDRLKVVNPVVLVSITNNDLPLSCQLTGDPLQSLTIDCDGTLPSNVIVSTIQCRYDNIFVDCSTLPRTIVTTSSTSGSHTVIIFASTTDGDVIPIGEASFSIPDIDLTFINNTPVLEGGVVYAEFQANRPGLEFYCHLTHLDDPNFRQDCSNGTFRREGIPKGDFTLRVIAFDPSREDKAVIRSRLWVHSTDPNDLFCIMYLRNRGWSVSGTTFSVDFTGTGAASTANNGQFECSINRQKPSPCTAPLMLTNLDPGSTHHVRIRPTSCGKDYRVWNKRFTVPNSS